MRTRPSSISRARPVWPTPALLQATVRLVAPCSISPSISALGWPTAPKPPSRTTEPSLMPAISVGHRLDDLVDHAGRFLEARLSGRCSAARPVCQGQAIHNKIIRASSVDAAAPRRAPHNDGTSHPPSSSARLTNFHTKSQMTPPDLASPWARACSICAKFRIFSGADMVSTMKPAAGMPDPLTHIAPHHLRETLPTFPGPA